MADHKLLSASTAVKQPENTMQNDNSPQLAETTSKVVTPPVPKAPVVHLPLKSKLSGPQPKTRPKDEQKTQKEVFVDIRLGEGTGGQVILQGIPKETLVKFSTYTKNALSSAPVAWTKTHGTQIFVLSADSAAPGAVKAVIKWLRESPNKAHLPQPKTTPFKQLVRVYQVTELLEVDPKQWELRSRILDHVRAEPLAVDELAAYWEVFKDDQRAMNHVVHRTAYFIYEEKISTKNLNPFLQTQSKLSYAIFTAFSQEEEHRLRVAKKEEAYLKREAKREANEKREAEFKEREAKRLEAAKARRQNAREGLRILSEDEAAAMMGH